MAEFVAEQKKIYEFPDIGDHLDEMMRDRIDCGINHERWQKRLPSEPDVTFKKKYEIAIGVDSTDQNVKRLRPENPEAKGTYHVQRAQKQGPVAD